MKKWISIGLITLLAACAEDGGALDGGVSPDASTADADVMTDAGPGTDASVTMDAGVMTDAGPSTDAGPGMDAGASTDAGPWTDAGASEVASIDWTLPPWIWSGRDETIQVQLADTSGAGLNVSPDRLSLEVASGTSTGTLSLASRVGAGTYAFTFHGLEEGSALRFDLRVDGAPVGMLSPALQVVVPLLHYAPASPARALSEIATNLSGNTWNPDSGRIVMIRNNDRMIHILAPDLTYLKALRLSSVPIGADLEDIVYLGGPPSAPEYALVDEYGRATIGVIPPDAVDVISLRGWQTIRYAGLPAVRNRGGEGIAYDPTTDRMWVCTEGSPMIVYEFARPAAGVDVSYDSDLAVTQPFDADASLGSTITDIGSCLFDPRTRRLLILSQESSRLVDVDWDGSVIATYDVDGAPQFEGVTLIAERDLLLTSEPNRIRPYTYIDPVP